MASDQHKKAMAHIYQKPKENDMVKALRMEITLSGKDGDKFNRVIIAFNTLFRFQGIIRKDIKDKTVIAVYLPEPKE